MVAARIANLGRGRPGENAAIGGINREQAAALLTVDPAGVERAKAVIAKGAEELQHAVDLGQVTVRSAAEIARLDPEAQKRIIAEVARNPVTRDSGVGMTHIPLSDSADTSEAKRPM